MTSIYDSYSRDELIQEIVMLKKRKKYGIVWEEKTEKIVELCKEKLPVLNEFKDKEILMSENNEFNILIEGDNYHGLSVLNYTHRGKIDIIYIDPPYNTGEEFKYNDKWVDKDDSYKHSKWLSFIKKRLQLARNLLTESGAIFISIDEHEISQLKILCDEIFSEKNFVEQIVWNKRIPKNDKGIGNIHEYVLLYVKNNESKIRFKLPKEGLSEIYSLLEKLKNQKKSPEFIEKKIRMLYKKNGYDRGITLYNNVDENYKIWGKINLCWPNAKTQGPRYEILHPVTKKAVRIPQKGWRWVKKTFDDKCEMNNVKQLSDGSYLCGRIWFGQDEKTQPSFVQYLDNVKDFLLRSIVSLKSDGSIELRNILKNSFGMHPKPTSLIKHLLSSCDNNSIVLDFFAGSGTTGHAVLEMNKEDGKDRKFILITNNEVDEKTEIKLEKKNIKKNSEEYKKEGICRKICYPRLKNVIEGYDNIKNEKIDGLGNNLKYYKTDFVDAKPFDMNKKKMVDRSTEMLCIKENCFKKIMEKDFFRIFSNGSGKFLGIVYDDEGIEPLINEIKRIKKKMHVYVFSLDQSAREEEFLKVIDKVELKPIPEVILNVYRRIFR